MQLEKHCVTVDILLHWFYRMIGIIHYTNVFSWGSGFVHLFVVLFLHMNIVCYTCNAIRKTLRYKRHFIHWVFRMIGITHQTYVLSFGSGFVHVCVSSSYVLINQVRMNRVLWSTAKILRQRFLTA